MTSLLGSSARKYLVTGSALLTLERPKTGGFARNVVWMLSRSAYLMSRVRHAPRLVLTGLRDRPAAGWRIAQRITVGAFALALVSQALLGIRPVVSSAITLPSVAPGSLPFVPVPLPTLTLPSIPIPGMPTISIPPIVIPTVPTLPTGSIPSPSGSATQTAPTNAPAPPTTTAQTTTAQATTVQTTTTQATSTPPTATTPTPMPQRPAPPTSHPKPLSAPPASPSTHVPPTSQTDLGPGSSAGRDFAEYPSAGGSRAAHGAGADEHSTADENQKRSALAGAKAVGSAHRVQRSLPPRGRKPHPSRHELNTPLRQKADVDPPRPSGLGWPWLVALLVPVFGAGWVTRGRLRTRLVAGVEADGRLEPKAASGPASTPAELAPTAEPDSDTPIAEATAAFELAGALADSDDLAGAEAAYLRADRLGHPAGASNLGVLLEQRGDLGGAQAAYRRADERGDATGAFNLGSLLAEQGDLVAAESAFRRADERGSAEAALNLGLLLQWRGDLMGANAAFRRAGERGDPELTDRAQVALAELHGLHAS